MKKISESPHENCLCVDKAPKSHMVDTLVLGSEGIAEKLVFKDHGNIDMLSYEDAVGEFLPMIKFSRESADIIFGELVKNDFEGPFTLYDIFGRVFQMRDTGYVYSDDLPWVEIDTHEDLERARKDVFPRLKGHKT